MSVHLHRSNRMEQLVDVLAEFAAEARSPFEPLTIVVQSSGMQRWLSLELSKRLGVLAGAQFPFPRSFLERVLGVVLGEDALAAAPFSPESLAWSIAALLPELTRRPSFAEVARYLKADPHGLKRLELSRHLSGVFDQYAVYRPEFVRAWEQGGGEGWQPELWRALVARHGAGHLAARAARFAARWTSLAELPDELPRQAHVFGVSSLPPVYVNLLALLGERIDLHLFQLCPSREYWADARRARAEAPDDPTGNPLIASLGRMGAEFQAVLESACNYVEGERDLYRDPGQATALAVLQSDMLALRERGRDAPRLRIAESDRSIAVHACHSPMREVEALRDQLLALFDDDASLEPRDVIVMMPDVEAYAPFIDAVFGVPLGERGFIPYRIADRRRRASSAVDEAFANLVALVGGRMKASEVLDVLALAPVAARFALDAEELRALSQWVRDSGVRWGTDAADRARHGQPELDQNTWRFGLRRLFLGYAMPADGRALFRGVLPFDDAEGEHVEALGKLGEFAERLFAWRDRLSQPRSVEAWCAALGELCDDLLAGDRDDAFELVRVREMLRALARQAEGAGFEEPLALEVIQAEVEARLEQERTTHQFLSGGVTFCAMLPMRSIPFRVVALLGLGDENFPRRRRAPGFDLVAQHPRLGDRSLREEDRYLFLEALLSARERLIISYVGRSVQDNSEKPPSAVVGELLDAIDASFEPPNAANAAATAGDDSGAQLAFCFEAARPAHAPFVLEHPLQPFSPRYFGADDDPRLFSYAPAEARGAAALAGSRPVHAQFQSAPLAFVLPERHVLQLDDLERFFAHPARAFLQKRLGLYLVGEPDLVEDREPIELDFLARHRIGAFVLERALAGELDKAAEAVRAAGWLPLGAPGDVLYADIRGDVAGVTRVAAAWAVGARLAPLEIDLDIGTARVSARLPDLWSEAQLVRQYSRVAAKSEIGAWLRHLVLQCSARRDDPRRTVVVGRAAEGRGGAAMRRFRPLDRGRALELLSDLVELYRIGQREPLRLFPAASRQYVAGLRADPGDPRGAERALSAARKKFEGDPRQRTRAERDDRYVERAFGDADPLASRAAPGDGAEPALDFAALSLRVFGPLLDHVEPEA
jgi:exodeoxyribonuclease V gamma subunit